MQVSHITRRRATRINDHYAHIRATLFRNDNALVNNRMRPRRIGARQNNKIREF